MSGNHAQNDAKRAPFWNVFAKIEDEKDACDLTRLGGFVGGYLAVSGIVLALVAYFQFDSYLDAYEAWGAVIGYVLQMMLGALLGFLVFKYQYFWAVWVLGIWALGEAVGKLIMTFTSYSAGGGGSIFGVFIAALIFVASVQMIRGRFALGQYRRQAQAA